MLEGSKGGHVWKRCSRRDDLVLWPKEGILYTVHLCSVSGLKRFDLAFWSGEQTKSVSLSDEVQARVLDRSQLWLMNDTDLGFIKEKC